jgi:hypothetical protein
MIKKALARLLIVLLLAGIVPGAFSFPETAHAASWYDNSWPNRVKITVLHGEVAADQTDFPVYVDLSALPAGFHSHVNSDGGDIRVTTSDGSTEVPREVVFYDSSNDTGELHFKAPSLSSSSDTDFYIYYGNSSATDYATNATYGAENVWTNSYKSVYHFEQDPSGTVLDSTSNHLDLTSANMTSGNEVSAVLAGQGYSFNGTDEQLVDSDQVWSNSDDAITVQFWNNITSAVAAEMNHTVFRWTTAGNERASAHVAWGGDMYFDFGTCCTNPRANGSYSGYADKWTMVSLTSNGSTQVRSYLDGVKKYSSEVTADNPDVDLTGFYIGSGASTEYHHGSLDEFRVSTVARAPEWISTEYNDQSAPSSFFTIGDEEDGQGQAVPARVLRLKGGIRLKGHVRLF